MSSPAARGFAVDFHNHLMPGADDGARDVAEAREGLRNLCAAGTVDLVAAVHVEASLAERSQAHAERMRRIGAAYDALGRLVSEEFPGLRLHRGAEVKLDTPRPDLSDPRLRLAGGRFVLVEFAGFEAPLFGVQQIHGLSEAGWVPVLAHPERYRRGGPIVELAREWIAAGARLQMNFGSLSGRFGEQPRSAAGALLAAGLYSYVSSDYHSRGGTWAEETALAISSLPGGDVVLGVFDLNGRRLLEDELPVPLPMLHERRGLVRRLKELVGVRPKNRRNHL